MTAVLLTPLARQFLAEKRREAVAIVTAGDTFTYSQRAWAWTVLTGQQPHPRSRRLKTGGVMAGLGPQMDDGDVA